MLKKPSKIRDTFKERTIRVTRKELAAALEALKASLLSEQKGQLLSSSVQDARWPRVFHKKKEGKREKLATTVDNNLFELVKHSNRLVSN